MPLTNGRYDILATKLYAPPVRPEFVPRPRLLKRLQEGQERTMSLISAPAGFGKTTLVSAWLHQNPEPVAWLSLDARDNDPHRFIAYLIAALQSIEESLGEGALGMCQAPQPPPIESVLTSLLNDLAAHTSPFVLVLDDYHVIETRAVDEALAFLVTHLPPHAHLLVATREDPQLPLGRLRVRGQLTEIRAADLRFAPEEAAAFLNDVMGLQLSVEEVVALESRTEGWIAGLQLAALSVQGRGDVSAFIANFAGDNRYIVDYLVEEVLQRQPDDLRSFLLQTSILERLCAPLCDAITGGTDAHRHLETLERGNLFLVPLDEKRLWFRYHHLFADVLQVHAMKEQPAQLASWHSRASEWFEQNGSFDAPGDAIHHAIAAGDFARVAALAERSWPAMDERFQTHVWLEWAQKLPESIVLCRPVLCVCYAWAHLNVGELEAGELRLQDAERCLAAHAAQEEGAPRPEAIVIVDEVQFLHLPANIHTARSFLAQALGDMRGALEHAEKALAILPVDDYLRRGPAAGMVGLCSWASGDLEAAYQALEEAMIDFRKAGNIHFSLCVTYGLADLRWLQGHPRDAVRCYEQSLAIANAHPNDVFEARADFYLGLGDLARERGDLDAAGQHISQSETLGEAAALPDWRCRFHQTKARYHEALGDLEGAQTELDEAALAFFRSPMPEWRPIAAQKARLSVLQGSLEEADAWARSEGLSFEDEPHFLSEFSQLTYARLRMAKWLQEGGRDAAGIAAVTCFLEGLRAAAVAEKRGGRLLEILLLLAQAHDHEGHTNQANECIIQALKLAAPEGYVRVFADEGAPLAALLARVPVTDSTLREYHQMLLGAFADVPGVASPLASQPLVEPLTQREIDVLALIAKGLSNQEIGKQLHLALSTIKGYNQSIYGKLGVRRRTEAVAKALELGLV